MKILWLSHLIPYPPKTGALSRSCNLLKELCKYHDVDVLAFHQKNLIAPYFSSEEEGLKKAEEELSQYCHDFVYVPINYDNMAMGKKWLALKSLITKDPYTINWLKSDAMHQLVQDYVNRTDYDLVHLDTISLVPYLKHFNDTPVSLTHHNIESHMLLRRATNQENLLSKFYFWQEGKRLERLEKTTSAAVNINVLCSDLDKDRLIELDNRCEAATIPNGVDPNYFLPDTSIQEENKLIFYGVMDFYPNTQAMMFFMEQLWPKLKSERPEITMDIIGQNPPDCLIQATKNQPGVTLHGYVDDLKSFINKSKYHGLPYHGWWWDKIKNARQFINEKSHCMPPSCSRRSLY